MTSPKLNGKGGGWLPIRATYPYPDENGALLFEVVRFETAVVDKRFRQRQPDGNGGWIWDITGTLNASSGRRLQLLGCTLCAVSTISRPSS